MMVRSDVGVTSMASSVPVDCAPLIAPENEPSPTPCRLTKAMPMRTKLK